MKRFAVMILLIIFLFCAIFIVSSNIKNNHHNGRYKYKNIVKIDEDLGGSKVLRSIDFNNLNERDEQAVEIVWEYIKNELSKDIDEVTISDRSLKEKFNLEKERTWAIFVDLDSDKEFEVMGINVSSFFCGIESCSFYLLKKEEGHYNNVCNEIFRVPGILKLEILETKHNGFNDIKVVSKINSQSYMLIFD